MKTLLRFVEFSSVVFLLLALAIVGCGVRLMAQSAASVNEKPNIPGVRNGVSVEAALTERLSLKLFCKGDGVEISTACTQNAINALRTMARQ